MKKIIKKIVFKLIKKKYKEAFFFKSTLEKDDSFIFFEKKFDYDLNYWILFFENIDKLIKSYKENIRNQNSKNLTIDKKSLFINQLCFNTMLDIYDKYSLNHKQEYDINDIRYNLVPFLGFIDQVMVFLFDILQKNNFNLIDVKNDNLLDNFKKLKENELDFFIIKFLSNYVLLAMNKISLNNYKNLSYFKTIIFYALLFGNIESFKENIKIETLISKAKKENIISDEDFLNICLTKSIFKEKYSENDFFELIYDIEYQNIEKTKMINENIKFEEKILKIYHFFDI